MAHPFHGRAEYDVRRIDCIKTSIFGAFRQGGEQRKNRTEPIVPNEGAQPYPFLFAKKETAIL
jgi:hypothetical protein